MVKKLPGLTVPRNATADERSFFQAVIEHLQVAAGDRGNALDRALTPRDLVDAGLATAVVKGGFAKLRAQTPDATDSASNPSSASFSVAAWDVITGLLGSDSGIQVLAYDANDSAYLRVPTAFLAPLLGLVDTSSVQDISAAWVFEDTVDVEGDALRFAGAQVVTTPGHGLQKTTGETIEVVDADLSINWSQLSDVPSTFTPSAHTHTAADVNDTVITPSQLVADADDYDVTDIATASIVRLSTDASRDITGMVPGIRRTIINVGLNDLVIKNSDASSSAANRFLMNSDLTLGANMSATFFYDLVDTKWRLIAFVN